MAIKQEPAPFFVALGDDYYGTGRTLMEAFNKLKNSEDDIDVDNVRFFEAKEVKVEMQLVKVQDLVQIS